MNLRRLAVDMWGCGESIEDEHRLMQALLDGISTSGATVLSTAKAEYCPHGLTLVCFLAESHAILTTWPEKAFATLDVLACGDIRIGDIELAVVRCLSPARVQEKNVVLENSHLRGGGAST
jgi:S-adenosylmethionine decarboxylase